LPLRLIDDARQMSHMFGLVGMIAHSLILATKALPALTKKHHPNVAHATTHGGTFLAVATVATN